MKKLWLIFGMEFGSRALRKFVGAAKIRRELRNFAGLEKIFLQGLRKLPAFSVFLFFSSFSCLIFLKTVSQQ